MSRVNNDITSAKRKHRDEELFQKHFDNLRRQTMSVARKATSEVPFAVDDLAMMAVVLKARSSRHDSNSESSIISRRIWIVLDVINFDNFSYFWFRRLMRSQNRLQLFQVFARELTLQMLSMSLRGWRWMTLLSRRPLRIIESSRLKCSTRTVMYVHSDGTYQSTTSRQMMNSSHWMHTYSCKTVRCLCTNHLRSSYLANSIQSRTEVVLNDSKKHKWLEFALLVSISQNQDDVVQKNVDLLLELSTVESLRYVMKIEIYLFFNRLDFNQFIEWILRIVFWAVLRFILSTSISSIQAFAESVLEVATSMKNISFVKDLLENPFLMRIVLSSKIIFRKAVQSSNVELVRLLLNTGAKIDQNHVSLLNATTVKIARMFVEANADVNEQEIARHNYSFSTDFIHTALCLAVARHDVKLTRYLISVGADVNRRFACGTPLAVAAWENQKELLELLLKQGADVNRFEDYNQLSKANVFQSAACSGNLDYVRLLIEVEADVNALAYHHHGMTALQAASLQDHSEMVNFLLKCGAGVNCPEDFDYRLSKTELTHRLCSLSQWKRIV